MDLYRKFICICFMLTILGCTTTQKRALMAGMGGAAAGGIIGHQSDKSLQGAAIGGLVGTTVSLAFDTDKKKQTQYEKGYEEGYRQGQVDYANSNWKSKTGQCPSSKPQKENP